MAEFERFLPRSVGMRLVMGPVCLFYGILFGNTAWFLMRMPMAPLDAWLMILLVVTQELLLAATAATLLMVIWALATPRWVETLFRTVWKRLLVAILLALLPILVLLIVSVVRHKLGPDLGP